MMSFNFLSKFALVYLILVTHGNTLRKPPFHAFSYCSQSAPRFSANQPPPPTTPPPGSAKLHELLALFQRFPSSRGINTRATDDGDDDGS